MSVIHVFLFMLDKKDEKTLSDSLRKPSPEM